MRYYCTSYCNHPHRVRDGYPIGHECYILPPAALRAEIAGDYDTANGLLRRLDRTASGRVSFETRIDYILPGEAEIKTYKVIFHGLTHDGDGWSVNDSWVAARHLERAEVIRLLRGRWEVFKANYAPRGRVADIDISGADHGDGVLAIEHAMTAFAELQEEPAELQEESCTLPSTPRPIVLANTFGP